MRSACCSSLAAISAIGAPALAQTDLFISEYKFQDAQISAVRTDGTNPRTLFALPASMWLPIGLTYQPSTGRLFWMDSAGGSDIVTSNLNGSGRATLVSPPGFGKGASLDNQGRVYFATDFRIWRVNADGTGLTSLFTSASTTNPVHPPRVDATNGHIYFGDDGTIKRADLDGSNVKVVVRGVSQARSVSLDIAGRRLYWTDTDTISDHICSADLDGSDIRVAVDVSPSVVQSSGMIDMLVDPVTDTLYFADELATVVYRVEPSTGANVTPIFTSSSGRTPSGLARSTGEPVQPRSDCNNNGIADDLDIAAGAPDCDQNGVPDSCQFNPCPTLTLLLDTGSDAASSSGRALGAPSAWQVFQPFDVPAEGWDLGQIALDGFNVNYHDGSGLSAKLFRDDGTGTRPDESEILVEATMNLRFNTNYINWVYAPFRATLAQGRYWVRVEGNDPAIYQASLNRGFNGLPSLSRGSSGNFIQSALPIALRLVESIGCPADFNADGFVDFFDFDDFVVAFELGDPRSDFNNDGFVDFFDFDDFVAAFEQGC
jgi:hypothetical protein